MNFFIGLLLTFATSSAWATFETDYNNLPSCGAKKDWIVNRHVNITPFKSILPLGHLNPGGGHVIPIHHLYFQLPGDASWNTYQTDIFFPGPMYVVAVEKNVEAGGYYDYRIHFKPCKEITFYFDHVKELTVDFLAELDNFVGANVLSMGSSTSYIVYKVFSKGQVHIGTAGGVGYNNSAVDFGVIDNQQTNFFINQDRYALPVTFPMPTWMTPEKLDAIIPKRHHQFCALDYMTATLKSYYEDKLGSWSPDGLYKRKEGPICGTINQDLDGTAQGNWFPSGGSAFDEGHALALVHDNIDPWIPVFSFGQNVVSMTGGEQATPYKFLPSYTGHINVDFAYVKPGSIYCYQNLMGSFNGLDLNGVILLQTFNTTLGPSRQIKIERQMSEPCPSNPAFTTNAVILDR